MAKYASLLRAVNVGGRSLSMARLRETYMSLGFTEVETYVQSGNVVFGATGTANALAAAIERAIAAELGLDVTVLVRSARDLTRIVEHNPLARAKADTKTLHVAFLRDRPTDAQVRAIDRRRFEPDRFEVIGREVYGQYPNGYGRTKLNNAFFERAFGTPATTRNWSTVCKLRELAVRPAGRSSA